MKKILRTVLSVLLIISTLWLILGVTVIIETGVDFATIVVGLFMFVFPFMIFLFLFFYIKKKPEEVNNSKKIQLNESAEAFDSSFETIDFPSEKVQLLTQENESQIIKSDSTTYEVKEKYDFTCIDFEIANEEMSSACSIGIVAVKNLKIVKEDYILIKPPSTYFNSKNIEIHGITYERVKDMPTFDTVWNEIKDYFTASKYLVAHNAHFDMSVLNQSACSYNLEIPNFRYIDSINFTSKVRESGNKLIDCAEYFGVDFGTHHNAIDDARTCANIMICAVNKSRFKSFHTYLKGYPSINVKMYSDLKPQKMFGRNISSSVKVSDITPTQTVFDTTHPFYQKNIVLTGTFDSLSRSVAMQKIVDVGGYVKGSVTTKTHFLVVGKQNLSIVDETGMSTKEKKAYELLENGSGIQLISEEAFLSLLSKR